MDNAKSVQLNAMEIKVLLRHYGSEIAEHDEFAADHNIERLRYLNKRLKDYSEQPSNTNQTGEAGKW